MVLWFASDEGRGEGQDQCHFLDNEFHVALVDLGLVLDELGALGVTCRRRLVVGLLEGTVP